MTVQRHPSRRRLQQWLVSGRPERIGDHVASCERCTTILESESSTPEWVQSALVAVTEPRAGFDERISSSVTDALLRREALEVLTDLFSLGWRVPRAIIDPGDVIEGES